MEGNLNDKFGKIKAFLKKAKIAAVNVLDDIFVVETDLDSKDSAKLKRRLKKRLRRQLKAIDKLVNKMTKWREKMESGEVALAELKSMHEKTTSRLEKIEAMEAESEEV